MSFGGCLTMGSGASAETSEAEEKFRNSINKVRLSKALIGKAPQSNDSPSPTPQRPNRDELLQMVKSAKAEVNNDWHAINEKKQPKTNTLSKAKWRRASTVTSRYYINDTNKQVTDKCIKVVDQYYSNLKHTLIPPRNMSTYSRQYLSTGYD